MQKLLLPLLWSGFCTPLFAQLNAGLKDPSIDWAAFIEMVVPADPVAAAAQGDPFATTSILKLQSDDTGFGPVQHSLSYYLWEAARQGEWDLFEDPELTRPTRFDAAIRRLMEPDTVIEFDPETYEERVYIQSKQAFPAEAPYLRVRQLLVYRNAAATFEIATTAIGPCDHEGNVFYWLRVPVNHADMPDPKHVVWSVRYVTEDTSPDPESWQEVKNTTGPLLTRFIDRIRGDSSVVLFTPEAKAVPMQDRPCLFTCLKTEAVFDPEQYTEEIVQTTLGIDQEQVLELQLVEEWHWDAFNQQLYTVLTAVSPRFLFNEQTEEGAEVWMKSLFYRRCIETREP
jgi:hypothetical protein